VSDDEDDKPTVVLDLNKLKNEKLQEEENLANIVEDLEFAVENLEPSGPKTKAKTKIPQESKPTKTAPLEVILFDYESDFFRENQDHFPENYSYKLIPSLSELNKVLSPRRFQILIFNYDSNPKVINQLSAQIKLKFPVTKTIIMAKNISQDKAKLHAKTPSGASSYYQLPLDSDKIESEFLKLIKEQK
jgi:hypothetical protein